MEDGQHPNREHVSYTHEHHPWLLHQWLPTIPIYWLNELGGYHAIIVGTVALAAAIFGFVASAATKRCSSAAWVVFFLTIGLMAARFRFNFGEPLWEEVFAKYNIHSALVHYGHNMPKEKMLAHRLMEHSDWALVAWSDQALLFLERSPSQKALIRERELEIVNPLAPDLDYITPQNAPRVLEEIERMKRREEMFPTAWVLKGRALLVLGRHAEAAIAYEKAMNSYNPAPLAQRELAFAYVQLGRFEEAERLLKNLPRDEINTGLLRQIEAASK